MGCEVRAGGHSSPWLEARGLLATFGEQRIITGKIGGFRKFDKVRYCGQDYFIKGRMSTGYAILMDLAGTRVALKPIPKFEKMKRVSARRSWMMTERPLPSCSCCPT